MLSCPMGERHVDVDFLADRHQRRCHPPVNDVVVAPIDIGGIEQWYRSGPATATERPGNGQGFQPYHAVRSGGKGRGGSAHRAPTKRPVGGPNGRMVWGTRCPPHSGTDSTANSRSGEAGAGVGRTSQRAHLGALPRIGRRRLVVAMAAQPRWGKCGCPAARDRAGTRANLPIHDSELTPRNRGSLSQSIPTPPQRRRVPADCSAGGRRVAESRRPHRSALVRRLLETRRELLAGPGRRRCDLAVGRQDCVAFGGGRSQTRLKAWLAE